MRTRSGSLYPKNSMAIDPTQPFPSNFFPPCQRSQKRRRQPERQPMDSAIDSVICSILQISKRPRSTCNRPEGVNEVDQRRNEKKGSRIVEPGIDVTRKRSRNRYHQCETNFLDALPDDLILAILCKVSASADSPSDVVNARLAYDSFSRIFFC